MPGGGPVTEQVFAEKADLLIERLTQLRDGVATVEVVAADIALLIAANQTREEAVLRTPRQIRGARPLGSL